MAEEAGKQEELKIETQVGEPVVYANLCQIAFTDEELMLHFAQRNFDNFNTRATGVVKVYMTIPHSLRFMLALNRTISRIPEARAALEEAMPPEMREQWQEMQQAIQEKANEQKDE